MYRAYGQQRGVTLIDTVVGLALLIFVFTGIIGVFKLSIDVVTNTKARIGALALANEQMEYVRSLPYPSVGTTGGIPAGLVPEDESMFLNGVQYTRHTLIRYLDLPQDGLGAADTNHITEDVKQAEVDVSWVSQSATRTLTLSTIVAPAGIEAAVPGGTISIAVQNAQAQALPGASVRIQNPSTTPAIDVTTDSDNSGFVTFIGAPAASGYRVTVSDTGYSTAQTYGVSGSLSNPSPGHLTVALNTTTGATFAIDLLSSYIIRTWKPITLTTWSDTFNDSSHIATSSKTVVSAGNDQLASGQMNGWVTSENVTPAYLAGWVQASWVTSTTTGTNVLYHVYTGSNALVPDAALPGNAAGFTMGPIDISGLATSTYPALALHADLSTTNASTTPYILSWQMTYNYGPEPLPNVSLAVRGAKTIGTNSGSPVYKYSVATTTSASANVTIPSLEWDTYTTSVTGSTYDLASSCNPQPNRIAPNSSVTTDLYLVAHTANSLLVDVRTSSGIVIPNASITLSRTAFTSAIAANYCGQSFFSGLSAGTASGGNAYTVAVTAAGYQAYSNAAVDVSGASRLSVVMVP